MQMAEKFAADISHHLRADIGHQRDTAAIGDPFTEGGDEKNYRPATKHSKISGADTLVNGKADDGGASDAEDGADAHQDDGGD